MLDKGLVRQYSLCGDPADRSSYRVGVLLEAAGRGGSRRVHEELHSGAVVEVRGPRNHFRLEEAERYLLVAGGIGITPILAMASELDRTGRPWSLVYGGRTRSSMAYTDRLAALGSHVRLWPQDENGLIDLPALLADPAPGTAAYACGPEPLLRVRCILDSLALAHRRTVRAAQELSGREVDVVHVVGGGARNTLLCRLTADACGLPVVAGPVEAAALGNVLVQARALDALHGGLGELRALLRDTHVLVRHEPAGEPAAWDAAERRLGTTG